MGIRSALAVAGLLAALGCAREADPATRGRQIVERMSTALASAKALSVTTREIRDRVKRDGSVQKIHVTRETVVRRPDRAYFRTTGEANTEGWYDGIGLTLVLHDHKVFGQARLPETLDRALDAMHERYDVPMPLSDFIYSNPAKALLADTTTGGWVSRETMDGHDVDHVAFKEKGLEWELWVPTAGTPLPLKAILRFPNSNRLRAADVTFSNWNLAPIIPADRFNPRVGEDYEGIAIIQRAAIVRHADEKGPATDPAKKP